MKWKQMKAQLNQKPNKMKSKIQNILTKTQFFKVIKSTTFTLEKPSQLLIRNIHINWLRYLYSKTHKSMPIYVHNKTPNLYKKPKDKLPVGIINSYELDFEHKTFHIQEVLSKPMDLSFGLLELKLVIPQQDYMQYFIQWQRYRKYWWSSVTTTPSLFEIGDIKQGDHEADADIVAKLPCGHQTVEQIKIKNCNNDLKNTACLTCTMSLERALFVLLLDGLNDDSKDDYLRLHRKIAPYKMSFALSYEDINNKKTLKSLATMLFHRLNLGEVSACLPSFYISLDEQIHKNLQMGIPYTAILNETTLQNGILHLLNSSTMLKEQIHIADFHTYAGLICNVK